MALNKRKSHYVKRDLCLFIIDTQTDFPIKERGRTIAFGTDLLVFGFAHSRSYHGIYTALLFRFLFIQVFYQSAIEPAIQG